MHFFVGLTKLFNDAFDLRTSILKLQDVLDPTLLRIYHLIREAKLELNVVLTKLLVHLLNLCDYVDHFELRRRRVWVLQKFGELLLLVDDRSASVLQHGDCVLTFLFCGRIFLFLSQL